MNGTGKSMLLRAIAHRCGIHIWEPEEGRRVQYNRYEHELYRYIGADGVVPGSFFSSAIFEYLANILDDWAFASPKTQLQFISLLKEMTERGHAIP